MCEIETSSLSLRLQYTFCEKKVHQAHLIMLFDTIYFLLKQKYLDLIG